MNKTRHFKNSVRGHAAWINDFSFRKIRQHLCICLSVPFLLLALQPASAASNSPVLPEPFATQFTPEKISQPAADRAYLVGILTKTARPVLENIAADTFFEMLPKREWENNRRLAAYTEGLARTLAGISPWLALPEDSTAEGKLRAEFAELARNALITATNPKNKNYRHFTLNNGLGGGPNRQLLVETAYIAHALVRAQNVLWDPLTKEQRANVRALMDIAGKLEPIDNSNWLLFASMMEAARWELFGEMDRKRLEYGVNKFVGEFYLGDGTYGDGKHFRWDYYNSFVIHPMLWRC